jgi:CrcB protein
MRLALTVGFCGGFTTFSAFSLETVRLIQRGEIGRAALYAAVSVLLSVGAAALGLALSRTIGGGR